MNTMLKITTLGALLACAGIAAAGNATPVGSLEYPHGPVRINPQPLPPLSSADASADRDINPQPLPPRQLPSDDASTDRDINPQPLPPRESRRS